MTNAQKIAIRLSEVRERLNEIAGLEGDEFTDEVRASLSPATERRSRPKAKTRRQPRPANTSHKPPGPKGT